MKEKYKERIEEIISVSFNLLEKKIANGGIVSKNEASFQLELATILKSIGNLYEFNKDEKFHLELENYIELKDISRKSGTTKARVDIYIEFGTEDEKANCALELKFLKKANHREPNNRYDVFKDLANIEDYKNNGVDLCYFYIATDHSHYVHQEVYSEDTGDFDFRDTKTYTAGTELVYRTDNPFGPPIILDNSYTFSWREPQKEYYFMHIKI